MTGRDFPRPWLQRRCTAGRFLALTFACAFLAVALLLLFANSAGQEAPPPTVTVGTSGEPTPFLEEP